MTSRQEFQLNSDKVLNLDKLLNDPLLNEAFMIVKQECVPKEPRQTVGIDLMDVMVIEGAKSIGADMFYQKLKSLTKVSSQKNSELDKEYIVQARQKLFSTGLYSVDEINEAEKLSMVGNNQQE